MLACNLKNLAAPYLMVKDTLEATREGLNESRVVLKIRLGPDKFDLLTNRKVEDRDPALKMMTTRKLEDRDPADTAVKDTLEATRVKSSTIQWRF